MRRSAGRLEKVLATAAAAAVVVGLSGCGAGGGDFSGPAPVRTGAAVTYVSISESPPAGSVDVRASWPLLFESTSLPRWALTDELVLPDGWVFSEGAVLDQLLALRPTVVTLVAGLPELSEGLAPGSFAAALRRLLGALRGARVPTVLVANLLPSSGPATTPTQDATVAAYNKAIAAACAAEGAGLVNADALFTQALRQGKAVLGPGDALTALGQGLLASGFRSVLGHRPVSR